MWIFASETVTAT